MDNFGAVFCLLESCYKRSSCPAGPVLQFQWYLQPYKPHSSSRRGSETAAPTEAGSHGGSVGCTVWPVLLRVRSCPAGGAPCLPQGVGSASGTFHLLLDPSWRGAGEMRLSDIVLQFHKTRWSVVSCIVNLIHYLINFLLLTPWVTPDSELLV